MPVLLLIIPLVVIVLVNIFNKKTGNTVSLPAGIAVVLFQMLVSLTSGAAAWLGADGFLSQFRMVSVLRIDFFSAVVLFTISLIALVTLLVVRQTDRQGMLNFTNLLLVSLMGMNGVVMVTDLFSLYVFLEITAVASFVLIAARKGKDSLEGSFKYLVMSALATIMMLFAIALIFMMTGDTSFQAVTDKIAGIVNTGNSGGDPALPFEYMLAFILFTAGLLIKAGVVPFHGWVPGAYSSAPAPVSIYLAGIVTKIAGVYSIMRLYNFIFKDVNQIGNILVVFGLLSIVVGALAAIGQTDFKKMLAYSSISQVGYIILGAGIATPLAFAGALLHFFNHATFKSLLFVNSASIEIQTGTRDIGKLGGLASRMPVTGGSSVVAFLSTAGIPPLSGFWSKFLIIVAAWQAASYASAVIALLASLLTLAYFLILQRKVFFGKLREGFEDIAESKGGIRAVSLILSAVTLLMGLLFPVVLLYARSIGVI